MKKHFLFLLALILPVHTFSFSLLGSPISVPEEKQFVIYNKQLEEKELPNAEDASISTTLLVYNIQTQAAKSTSMFYIQGNQLHTFENSVWAIPVTTMLTVAVFEYILDNNIVNNLAFQNVNIRQDFTLSGSTPYGPVIDLDGHQFYFYITFYLKNERNGETKIKTIKYKRPITSSDITANKYVNLTTDALKEILLELKPWLINNLKVQVIKNKQSNNSVPSLG
ncbi:hypothetical protein IB642_01175 [Allofrancisella guangzhouensis]|uniref:ABC-type transport auxiliary lipoprotein component domain-containing protein n=1 Tax=Allofrancisella guangzhouensis TaxID=594679 RepID=A0A0A8E9L6_9GAMM|nr:hypothetical protein [Allofrancisella guangzhouensis]AJC48866.1 hypothetical protein SD28_04095 [Allofrancisella guangzhouensis]MBK2026940.1 hypothetical protein [Allofrancisella guangzhouensis]MBK2043630.1 hypothetical protein [Allofrancisella guangzhouensis]MBK2045974.1 hypothetical protein [Allofrancisella guangzhouensis]